MLETVFRCHYHFSGWGYGTCCDNKTSTQGKVRNRDLIGTGYTKCSLCNSNAAVDVAYDPIINEWLKHVNVVWNISHRSRVDSGGPGLEPKTCSVWIQNHPGSWPAPWRWAKPGHVSVNLRVSPGWLKLSCLVPGFAFRVVLFMVAFRYPTVNWIVITMVSQCFFWIYWLRVWVKYDDRPSLPDPRTERHPSVNDLRSCILGNHSGYWLQIVLTEVLASFVSKTGSDTLPTHLEKKSPMSINNLKYRILGNISGALLQTSIVEELAASVGR